MTSTNTARIRRQIEATIAQRQLYIDMLQVAIDAGRADDFFATRLAATIDELTTEIGADMDALLQYA
jgi:hypothetical protein